MRAVVIPFSAMGTDDSLPDDVETLKAMLLSERAARLAAEADVQARMLLIEKLKLTIRKLRHERFGSRRSVGACSISLSSSSPIWKQTRRRPRRRLGHHPSLPFPSQRPETRVSILDSGHQSGRPRPRVFQKPSIARGKMVAQPVLPLG
jgi:hypothetical protein